MPFTERLNISNAARNKFDMEVITLDSRNSKPLSESYLDRVICKSEPVEIRIQYDCITFARQHIDLVIEYLIISFCAESIAQLSDIVSADAVRLSWHDQYFRMVVQPVRYKELSELLFYVAACLTGNTEEAGADETDWMDSIQEYEEKIDDRRLQFPEFIDSYYANLIHGVYPEEGVSRKVYIKHPERKFGYWKSAASIKIGYPFYVCPEAWIVPKQSDLSVILETYSGIDKKIILQRADRYNNEDADVYITASQAVTLKNPVHLINARRCASRLSGRRVNSQPTGCNVSDFGDVLVIEDDSYYFVFFADELNKLHFEDIKEVYASLNPVYKNIQSLLGMSAEVRCDWLQMDDEAFEQLCYDIIYYNPRFDSRTIQKMGKSRSRDGGRDITVWTKGRPGNNPLMFVFQCKFLRPGASLAASRLPNAANVIMQYGAQGYGVFTTGVIDSTLYDMLNGFSQTRLGIDVSETWSIYEIERYLARTPELKNRYFDKVG